MKLARVLTVMALLLVSRASRASTYAETYVEPVFLDCAGNRIFPSAFGGTGGLASDMDIDQDGRYYTSSVGGFDEDTDSDPIFASINTAIASTTTGGVVNIMVPGVYRENVKVTDSITIRARKDGDIVLEGSCIPGGIGVEVTVSDLVVRIENLTIRGYETGIACEESTLTVFNSRIDTCDVGIAPPIEKPFTLIGSSIGNSSVAGVDGPSGDWQITGSTIDGCEYGIRLLQSGGFSWVRVTDSKIVRSNSKWA